MYLGITNYQSKGARRHISYIMKMIQISADDNIPIQNFYFLTSILNRDELGFFTFLLPTRSDLICGSLELSAHH